MRTSDRAFTPLFFTSLEHCTQGRRQPFAAAVIRTYRQKRREKRALPGVIRFSDPREIARVKRGIRAERREEVRQRRGLRGSADYSKSNTLVRQSSKYLMIFTCMNLSQHPS